jgi:tRNA dimethylallyltransferase
VLRGVFQGPGADWALRRALEKRIENEGCDELHRELQQLDPVAAARLHPNDARRIIRAIEVCRLTGRPMSDQHDQPPRPIEERTPHVYWLSPPRDWLHERINRRVEQMFEQGLLEEVQRLTQLPEPLSHTARQALGYKEVLDWLETSPADSHVPPPELIDLIQTRTRQFAKRQHTWFRNLEECTAIPIHGDESPTELAGQLAARQ